MPYRLTGFVGSQTHTLSSGNPRGEPRASKGRQYQGGLKVITSRAAIGRAEGWVEKGVFGPSPGRLSLFPDWSILPVPVRCRCAVYSSRRGGFKPTCTYSTTPDWRLHHIQCVFLRGMPLCNDSYRPLNICVATHVCLPTLLW